MALPALRPQVLKTRHVLPADRHRPQEHLLGAHPEAVISVLLPVDDEFFVRLAVTGRTDDGVLLALVVPVAAWLNGSHGITPGVSARFSARAGRAGLPPLP